MHENKWVDLASDARDVVEQQCACGCEMKRARADGRDANGWVVTQPAQRVTPAMARVKVR